MTIYLIVIFALAAIYMVLNFKRDIHMLQQNSYRIERFWRWQRDNLANAWRLADVALLFLLFSTLLDPRASALVIGLTAVTKIFLILTAKYKKPLVFTKRVWRIYAATAVIPLLGFAALCILGLLGRLDGIWSSANEIVIPLGALLMVTIFSWAFAIAAVWCLSPVERAINNRYRREAMDVLRAKPELKIIGITGSFGKTSTKHYLHRILSEHYDTLMTPGSYNTPMGVIRTIRELMKPHHQVFICEMGAKQKGDIKEICDIVNPTVGIITAVGPMHLETFKSIENVQATKFELADALPADGLAVINNDFEYCASRPVTNCESVRYAVASPDGADYMVTSVAYSPAGTEFEIAGPDNFSMHLTTRLVGECNISNLLAAIIIALRLGVPENKIRYAVSRIEQVEHRLNVKTTPGGVTIIDDAFNSNPSGSRMAVDVLAGFTSGRRIIVTPGMIELGDKQYELNRELGEHIGRNLDIAIIVGEYNRQALCDGVLATGFDKKNLHTVGSFAESQVLLGRMLKSGDTVLYENDLPDTFK